MSDRRLIDANALCQNIKTSAQYKALSHLVKKCVEGE